MNKIKSLIHRELIDYKILLRNTPSITICIFTVALICANLMANKELINFKYLALDCGFVFSWIMFLSMDIICKRYGAKACIKISIFSLFINLCVCFIFFLLSKTNGNWAEYYNFNNEQINKSLNKTFGSSWYVVLGSATAFFISSTINAILNKTIGIKLDKIGMKDNFSTFAIRSYISTFIAQFMDNFIFALIVSKIFFGWTWTQIILCSCFGGFCELLCEIIFSRMGYKILTEWEKENIGKAYFDFRKNLQQKE